MKLPFRWLNVQNELVIYENLFIGYEGLMKYYNEELYHKKYNYSYLLIVAFCYLFMNIKDFPPMYVYTVLLSLDDFSSINILFMNPQESD